MPSQNAAAVIVNTGGTPDNLKQWSDKNNLQWHEYDGALLTNRTGGGLVAGDVVRLSGANSSSVVAGDTVASHRQFVVAMATIADTVAGECARSGIVNAKSTGAITNGDYVRKSATAKTIETTGVGHTNAGPIPDGTLGIAIATAAAGFCLIYLFPVTWIKANNLLNSSGTDQSVVSTTTETDVTGSVVSILGNTLPIAGGLITVEAVGAVNGTNTLTHLTTFRVYYGATVVASIVVRTGIAGANPNQLTSEAFALRAEVSGHNATNSQRGVIVYTGREVNTTGLAVVDVSPSVVRGSATEDSTATKTFKLTVQHNQNNASHFAVFERVRVTMPPT